MLAAHRGVHRWVWRILLPLLILLFGAALAARREVPLRPLDPALAPVAVPDDLTPAGKG